MGDLCRVTKNVTLATSTVNIWVDQLHLIHGNEKIIIRDLKRVINLLVGLKAYDGYCQNDGNGYRKQTDTYSEANSMAGIQQQKLWLLFRQAKQHGLLS